MQLLKYGFKDGKLVHVDTVSRGLSCGCVCPSCGGVLEAHKGDQRQNHFKHYSVTDCEHGSESALHIMAKNIIATTKIVYIPRAPRNIYDLSPLGKCYKFDNAYIEKAFSPEIRCDVLLQTEDVVLNVEIKVTHEVDVSKKLKLFNENLRTIEIDLSDMTDDFSEGEIRKIIESGTHTKLIFSPKSKEIYAKWLLGEWKEVFRDRGRNSYVRNCRYATGNKVTYICHGGSPYRSDYISNECHECWGSNEFDEDRGCILCRGLYGNLDYASINKIVNIKRKNNIVQYAELIVNGEKITYGKKS